MSQSESVDLFEVYAARGPAEARLAELRRAFPGCACFMKARRVKVEGREHLVYCVVKRPGVRVDGEVKA